MGVQGSMVSRVGRPVPKENAEGAVEPAAVPKSVDPADEGLLKPEKPPPKPDAAAHPHFMKAQLTLNVLFQSRSPVPKLLPCEIINTIKDQ